MVNAANGLFTWPPGVSQAGTTNLVSVQAANNGTPALMATQNFYITVHPVNPPVIAGGILPNGGLTVTVHGDAGPDYSLQASTNLAQWEALLTNLAPTLPFSWTDVTATNFTSRFYRVQLSP